MRSPSNANSTDCTALGYRRGGMVLRGKNMQLPSAYILSESVSCFDQHGGLDRLWQRSSMRTSASGFFCGAIFSRIAIARAFSFFLSSAMESSLRAKVSQRNIGDF